MVTRRSLFALFSPQGAVAGLLRQRRDTFVSPATSYTLSAMPSGVVLVFLNGLLMSEGTDYSIFQRLLTFSSAQSSSRQSPLIIQVHYWSL